MVTVSVTVAVTVIPPPSELPLPIVDPVSLLVDIVEMAVRPGVHCSVTVMVTAGASVQRTLDTLRKWSGEAEMMLAREERAIMVNDFILEKETRRQEEITTSK